MQGSIVRRGKKWCVVLDLGRDAVAHKRKQKWHSGYATKKDAERARAELLYGLDRGTYVEPSKATVADFLRSWLENYARPNVSPKTFHRYQEIVNGRLIPDLGTIPLRKLTPSHILGAYGRWSRRQQANGKPLSAQTLLHYHRVLHEALDRAVKWQQLVNNPAGAVDAPRVDRHVITPLDVEQARALLSVTPRDAEYGPVIAVALLTGMRLGEVTGLQWRDIDWERKTVSVRRSLQKVKGYGLLVKEPKTKRSSRNITLWDQATAVLKQTRIRQNELKLKLGPAYRDQNYVFALADGTPLDPQAVRRHFRKLLDLAAVPHVRFHDLRHTHATLLLAQDEHPKVVSERLGHATIGITLDTYSHVLPNLQERAARKLDELLLANG